MKMAQQKQLNRSPQGLERTEGGGEGVLWRCRMKPRNTDALQRFSVVALAGCLSSFLVESEAAHAMTNILHLLIPLFFFFLKPVLVFLNIILKAIPDLIDKLFHSFFFFNRLGCSYWLN